MRRRGNANWNFASGSQSRAPTQSQPGPSDSQHFTAPTSTQTALGGWSSSQSQFSTQSTSVTNSTSVFSYLSDDDDDDLESTQTTLGWNSQVDKELSELDEDSYSLNSDETEALEEVWADFTLSQSQLPEFTSSHPQIGQDPTPPTPSSARTLAQPPQSMEDPQSREEPHARGEPRATEEQSLGPVTSHYSRPDITRGAIIPDGLKTRLELVWRMFNMFANV